MSTAATTPGNGNPNVGKASGIMAASLFLSRVLGLLRSSVIAAMFGQTVYTDAYRFSFVIPDLLFFLIAGGALSSAFIPVFSEYLHTDREGDAWHVFNSVSSIMLLVISGLVVVAWIFAPFLITIPAKGSPETWEIGAQLSRIVLPAQIAFFLGGLMFGTLYAKRAFAVPGLGPNLYNLGIIFGALVISHYVDPSIAGLSWGALIGAVLGNFVLPLFAMKKLGGSIRFVLDTQHPGVRKVFRLMLPVILGLSLPAVYSMIMLFFGGFYEKGVPSALDNGDRIMQAPLAVFGQSFAIAAFPALSQFFAQDRMDAFRDQLAKTLRIVLYLTLPVSALMIAMPEGVVKLLLEHGHFTAVDTDRTVPIIRLFAIGVAAWCMHPVLMRAFFSVQQTVRPILVSTAATVVFFVLCFALTNTPLQHLGLPLAGSIAAAAMVFALLFNLRSFAGDLDYKGIMSTFGKSALASVLMGGACFGGMKLLLNAHTGKLVFDGAFVVLALIGVWLYILLTRLLKMPESDYVDRAMKRLKRA
ncbi:MAG: murein biosynthesis integral membrane protein MurJ [Armatimonadetes bacterium]|nr:murein biosynthesis integral membrane protein MurJ [Armatimonadota bacterium]